VFRQTARTFEPTTSTPKQARRFVEECMISWGMSGVSEPVLLAVSELTTNAVTHGDGPITLTLSTKDDRVRVEVENEGAGTPVLRKPDPERQVTGGWGLHLVDTLTDDWGIDVRPRKTAVWFEQRLDTEQHHRRAPGSSA
jgi:serine/threonine-protein kinase RsbW